MRYNKQKLVGESKFMMLKHCCDGYCKSIIFLKILNDRSEPNRVSAICKYYMYLQALDFQRKKNEFLQYVQFSSCHLMKLKNSQRNYIFLKNYIVKRQWN